jgi:hypothetical protein
MDRSSSTFSTLINYVPMTAAFAPPLAALWMRRRLDTPVGRAALVWLAIAIYGVVHHVSFSFVRSAPPTPQIGAVGTVLYLPLFLPHTLQWIGPRARRWLWPAVGAWLACALALFAALGSGREFHTVASPLVAVLMWIPTALALAHCVRRSPDEVTRQDWFWILMAQLLFFTINIVRKPLLEAFMARHWDAIVAMSYAFLLLYALSYLMAARGMLLGARAASRSSGLRPSYPSPRPT